MFWGKNGECGTEQRVGTRGVHLELRDIGAGETHQGTHRFANPVALHVLDRFGPVHCVQVRVQTVGVRSNPHVPLLEFARVDREVPALRAALCGHFFVSEHGTQARAPVHWRFAHIRQAVVLQNFFTFTWAQVRPCSSAGVTRTSFELFDQFTDGARLGCVNVIPSVENLGEDPLRPLHELRIGRSECTTRVMSQSQAAQLPAHVIYVLIRSDPGVLARLNRVLFSRQTERVIAQCVHDVASAHPLIARIHICCQIPQRVTHVQTAPRRVREHVHEIHGRPQVTVIPGQVAHRVGGRKSPLFFPTILPFEFNVSRQLRIVAIGGLLRSVTHWRPFGVVSVYSCVFTATLGYLTRTGVAMSATSKLPGRKNGSSP